MKAKKLNEYKLPYVILISRMLEFFEVEMEDELSEDLKQTNEINLSMLNRIGFQKVNGSWTYKGGRGEGLEQVELLNKTKLKFLL